MGDHDMIVYRYAVHGDLPDAAVDEMRRVHGLRNRLVEHDLAHEAAVAAIWAGHPAVAATLAERDRCEDAVEAAREAVAAAKSAGRGKVPVAAS